MKILKNILAVINTICLILLLLITSIEIPTFTYGFYGHEYKKNGTYDQIRISESDLKSVTIKLMDYMKGKDDNLNITVKINGENREFFNNKEKYHMVDVQHLFSIGYTARMIIVFIFLITFLIGFLKENKMIIITYIKSWRTGIIIFTVLIGIFVGIILSDFNKYFTIFHEIFFTNDLWLLDPNTDLLINIVPLGFFTDIFILIGIVYLVLSAIVVIGSSLILNKKKILQ